MNKLRRIRSWWQFSFQIESDMILVTVFFLIMNQMEFRLVHNSLVRNMIVVTVLLFIIIKRKTVTNWKESERRFSDCAGWAHSKPSIFPANFPGLEKKPAIRLEAVRESGVSRHHAGWIEGPPYTAQYARVPWCSGGVSGWCPEWGTRDCRTIPVSRTAVRLRFFEQTNKQS